MARRTTPLSATEIKNAKPRDKDYKLFDGEGLFLLVTKSGGKHWKLKYRIHGKEKKVSLGSYPAITLSKARELKLEHQTEIAQKIDPNQRKKAAKEKAIQEEEAKANTFYAVSQKWLDSYKGEVSENYHGKLGRTLNNHVYPRIKHIPMKEITRRDIIGLLDEVRAKGFQETGRRVSMLLNKIYKYAVTYEYTTHNIIADIELKVVVGTRNTKHYPTFTKIKDIKALLHNIDEYTGDYSTKMALKTLPYVFTRSFNIRHMEWIEIDFENKEWIIPAHKMKMKTEFILPLPTQVIEILKEVKRHELSEKYVFVSNVYNDKPLSENTLSSGIRRMGYGKDEFVPHGFRAMFSTIVSENGRTAIGNDYSREVREALLAHKETDKTADSYNHAEYKEQKRTVIQWYADYLDSIKALDRSQCI